VKQLRKVHEPELALMGALIEGRVYKSEGVNEVARLPTLGTLQAQIVGLLSSPSAQLAAVLSEASGGKLARTLEGRSSLPTVMTMPLPPLMHWLTPASAPAPPASHHDDNEGARQTNQQGSIRLFGYLYG
jgi:hypothetical protein